MNSIRIRDENSLWKTFSSVDGRGRRKKKERRTSGKGSTINICHFGHDFFFVELYEDAVSRARNRFHCVNVCTYNKKGCKGQRIHSRNSAPFVNERINERGGRGRGREMMGEKNFPDARKMSSTICKQVLRMGPALSNETLRCNLVLHACVCASPPLSLPLRPC